MGLCVPEDEEGVPENKFPEKSLPSNPFMVETKKKKKKKWYYNYFYQIYSIYFVYL